MKEKNNTILKDGFDSLRRFITIFSPAILGVLFFGLIACSADEKLDVEKRYNIKAVESVVQAYAGAYPAEKLDFKSSIGQSIGYDDNVNLDSSKEGDIFFETRFKSGIEKPFYLGFALWQDMKLKLDYNFDFIAYTEITDATVVDNNFNLNLQNRLVGKNILEFNYNFGLIDYPKYDPGSHIANKASIGFKSYFTPKFYGRLGYGYMYKKYDDRKARYANGTKSSSKRTDQRHIAELETGYYLWEHTSVKLRGQYYINDSNDLYYDYYDYSYYKVSLTAIQVFNEKLFGLLSCAAGFKDYEHRTTFDNSHTQEDEIFIVNTALLYDFTPSISLSLDFTYRENDSNEPRDEYTETIISSGLYYSF